MAPRARLLDSAGLAQRRHHGPVPVSGRRHERRAAASGPLVDVGGVQQKERTVLAAQLAMPSARSPSSHRRCLHDSL